MPDPSRRLEVNGHAVIRGLPSRSWSSSRADGAPFGLRQDLQPLRLDGIAAYLTDAIRAGGQVLQGLLKLFYFLLRTLKQRQVDLPLDDGRIPLAQAIVCLITQTSSQFVNFSARFCKLFLQAFPIRCRHGALPVLRLGGVFI